MSSAQKSEIEAVISPYIDFRRRLAHFQLLNFGVQCARDCYQNKRSACCGKDNIIIFWADLVINIFLCESDQPDVLSKAIQHPLHTEKCIFLGEMGCLWRIKPLVCAMFLCDMVKEHVLHTQPGFLEDWNRFKHEAKCFRWPDRPVLFDRLEHIFIAMGIRSSLMHLNSSPGMLKVKREAGLVAT